MVKSPLLKVSRDNNQTQFPTGSFQRCCHFTSFLSTFKTKPSTPRRHGLETKLRMKNELVVLRDVWRSTNWNGGKAQPLRFSILEFIECLYRWHWLWRNLVYQSYSLKNDNRAHWQIITIPITTDHFDQVFLSITQSQRICAGIFPRLMEPCHPEEAGTHRKGVASENFYYTLHHFVCLGLSAIFGMCIRHWY